MTIGCKLRQPCSRPMTADGPPRRTRVGDLEIAHLESGPADGPLVICTHGFPDDAHSFDGLRRRLGEAGWHAVAPWLRGYPPSDAAPDGRYQSAALARDLLGLAEALAPGRRVALVGHDWGAIASVAAALLAPERVAAVVSLALPHPAVAAAWLLGDHEQRRRSWYMWFFQMRVFAEAALVAEDAALVEQLWQDWSPGYRHPAEDMRRLRALFAQDEVAAAAIGYYRCMLDVREQADELTADQAQASFGRLAVPSLFLAGADDGCFAAGAVHESRDHCDAPVRTEVLAGCGHFLHLERPAEVGDRVLGFLEEHRAALDA